MPVLRVAVPVPLPTLFDYLPPPDEPMPPPGSRVRVPFGRRELVGVVIARAERSQAAGALKPVGAVLDRGLIGPELMKLVDWCIRYYAAAPGELVNLALPGALRRLRPFRPAPPEAYELTPKGREQNLERAPKQAAVRRLLADGALARGRLLEAGASAEVLRRMQARELLRPAGRPVNAAVSGPVLNPGQRAAAARILDSRHHFRALLLAGVTGSGKTEVYLRAARRILRRGRQVLMLLPEIGLTPQLVRRVEARLGERAWIYHSGLSEGERLATWSAAREGRARVVVGTRSAVFLPLADPGLIVVDEEHDGSFKQNDSIRYHGRDVAIMRARLLDVPVVLGSATPSLESLNNARTGRYTLLELPERAGAGRMPGWRVEDTRGQRAPGGLTPRLLAAVAERLERGEQVLLYRNRRGYAPVLICNECGWQADCSRCSAHLTWHRQAGNLTCHHCGHTEPLPPRCPACQAPDLKGLGAGTERLEALLAERFPDVPLYRVDSDSMARRDDFDRLLARVTAGESCILVGTQMLAKGHHLPGITLAAVLDADQALYSADFRAPERLAQAVFQVAGRAGRGRREGRFILQTRHPDHALIRQLAAGSYLDCARLLLDERLAAGLPPGRPLALLRAEAQTPEPARAFLAAAMEPLKASGLDCHGPLPAILHRRGGYWRYQTWLQTESRHRLVAGLQSAIEAIRELDRGRQVRWHLDMDPLEL